jgi:serine/threonine protein kinase
MQERFNQYYLTEQLASKPLRSVYLAHRVNDASQKVVVKLFDAACLNLEEESESLLHKVEWTKQFKHAHIVPVVDLGIEQGQPYVVSKYLGSGSLRHRMNRLSPQRLDLQEALRIIFYVGQALCYAHEHNILHGNIKPENIFFNKQGKVFLADFRLASFINVTKLNYKSDPHTTCYMAPEQFSGTMSEKSDQYALACLAYELITGRAPFSAQGFFSMWAKQNTQYAAPLCDLVPNLPEPIERTVLKGMAKDASDRYANVSTFLRDLETISLSPASLSTSVSSRTLIAPTSNTLTTRGTEALDIRETDPVLVTRLSKAPLATRLLDRSEHLNHGHNTSKNRDASTEPLDVRETDPALVTRLSKAPLATRLLDRSEHLNHDHSTSKTRDAATEPLDTIETETDPALVTHLGKNPLATRLLDRPEHINHNHSTSKTRDAATEPLDTIETETDPALVARLGKNPLATRLLDRPEHINHDHSTSKTRDAATEPLDTIETETDPALVARLSKTPVPTRLLDRPEHGKHDHNTSKTQETLPREAHVDSLPIGRLPQPGKPVTPTLWLAFALSSIVILLGTVILYAIVPLRSSPASFNKSVKSSPVMPKPQNLATRATPTPHTTTHTLPIPPAQPKQQSINRPSVAPTPTPQPVQTSLTGTYAQQIQTYNLTTEGTVDWVDWGLNTPQDVNRKANAQQQISNFTVTGNATVQRDSYYSNSNIEWFDGTPQPTTALSQTWGVCVTGINNGFSITVPVSTTSRTLRIYVGAKLAHGQLTASLDGKTYTDATLDMTHDPNSTQANGIYTLVFNGSASNQMLTVTYTETDTNGSNGYVMLQAATLQ